MSFDEMPGRELSRSQRTGEGLILSMLDIDHFKNFKDSFGHEAGDEVPETAVRMEISMNKTSEVFCRNLVLTAAVWLVAPGLNSAHGQAQPGGAPGSPLPATTPPEIIKPVPSSELKSADTVFDELDVGRRGYVTRRETEDLIGFGEAFRAVDTQSSGRLTRAQFRKAWALYKVEKQ